MTKIKSWIIVLLSVALLCCSLGVLGFFYKPNQTVAADSSDPDTTPDTDWGDAQWIWGGFPTVSNYYMIFRKDFDYNASSSAVAKIACESKYWLYVNGELVVYEGQLKRGINDNGTYFDKVDLKNNLVEGKNTITVMVTYWGEKDATTATWESTHETATDSNGKRIDENYSHNNSGKAGFLFRLQSTNNDDIISDETWLRHRNNAYMDDSGDSHCSNYDNSNNPASNYSFTPTYFNNQNVANPQPNYRLPEFNGVYDARYEVRDQSGRIWWDKDFVVDTNYDAGWGASTEYGKAYDATRTGDSINDKFASPWGALYQRSIPLLKFSAIKEYTNNSVIKSAWIDTNHSTGGILCCYLPYNAQVTPYLKVIDTVGGNKIGMYTERYYDTQGAYSIRNTYVTKASEDPQEIEIMCWFSGQYVYYEVPAGVTVEAVGYRESGYDTELTTSNFDSDNDTFDNLWTMSQRTLYITMRDNFMDCPDRERAQWWGDVTSEMMMMMYSLDTDSYALYEKGIDTILGWADVYGGNFGTLAPVNNTTMYLPMQSLAGIVGFYDYYLYTGKTEIVNQVFDFSYNYLNKWEFQENGLVTHLSGASWDWMDHGDNADQTVIENAWYYWAMGSVKDMANVLIEANAGNTDLVNSLTEKVEILTARRNALRIGYQTLWNNSLGGYYGSTTNALPDDRGNALAVCSGLAPSNKYASLLNNVFKKIQNSSPYMERYVLEAMVKMGYMEDAQNRMTTRYGEMANYYFDYEPTNANSGTDRKYTTLWELFSTTDASGNPIYGYNRGTPNHAWSGAPLIIMSKYMAGVQPVDAGYETYQVVPDLGTVNTISTNFNTIKGSLSVSILKNATKANTYKITVNQGFNGSTLIVAAPRFKDLNTVIKINGTEVYANQADKGVEGYTMTGYDDNYIYYSLIPTNGSDVVVDVEGQEYSNTAQEVKPNVYAQYTFADGAGTDVTGRGHDLVKYPSTSTATTANDGNGTYFQFDGNTVFYAEGAGSNKTGYDFMDGLASENFTLSLDFKIDSDYSYTTDRVPIFSIWGYNYKDGIDNNVGGAAETRASSLTIENYNSSEKYADLRFMWPNSNGDTPYWGPWTRVKLDTWSTFTFTWNAATNQAVVTMTNQLTSSNTEKGTDDYFTDTALNQTFSNATARFTLGGYYTDTLTGGNGLVANAAFKGGIKNVTITTTPADKISFFTDETNYNSSSQKLILANANNNVPAWSTAQQAWSLNRNVLLYAPADQTGGYDFMDNYVGKDFTISTTFMLPRNIDSYNVIDGIGALFSLWGGFWDSGIYNGSDANNMGSSVMIMPYDSGSESAELRFGFAYDDTNGSPVNSWDSQKRATITTDEFHNLTFSVSADLSIVAYLDGVKTWEYDMSSSQTFKNTSVQFCIGGMIGSLSNSTPQKTTCAYFRNFDIYGYKMTEIEMKSEAVKHSADITCVGGSIRIQAPAGLRFGYEINQSAVDTLQTLLGATKAEYGYLTIPKVLLGGAELTVETEGAANALVDKWYSNTMFTVVLMNIPDANYTTVITSRAYVKFTLADGTIYYAYSRMTERCIADIARAALSDYDYTASDVYKYSVLIDGEQYYSRYSQAQRNEMAKYAN